LVIETTCKKFQENVYTEKQTLNIAFHKSYVTRRNYRATS